MLGSWANGRWPGHMSPIPDNQLQSSNFHLFPLLSPWRPLTFTMAAPAPPCLKPHKAEGLLTDFCGHCLTYGCKHLSPILWLT